MPVADVAQPIFSVLRQAADYLISQAPDSKRFLNLREGLESLRSHHTTTRLALLAGLGSTVEEQERRWDEVIARLSDEAASRSGSNFRRRSNRLVPNWLLSGGVDVWLGFANG